MKNKNICAVLALDKIELHGNILPGSQPVAKFNQAQLDKLDAALAEKDTSALDQKIKDQADTIATHESNESAISQAVKAAYALNGLELTEGTSAVEAIAALSEKCKEYGDSADTHSIVNTDGVDKSTEEDPSANYEHNKVMTDKSKFKKIL